MIEIVQSWPFVQSPYTGSATLVEGAPGWDDWIDGVCPRCRVCLRALRAGHVSKWDWPNLRHQLTFPLSHCWLCRVQQGYFIHTSWEG